MKIHFLAFLARYRQFILYILIGGTGFLLDIGILALFKHFSSVSASYGVVLSQSVVIFYNFSLNKYWTFAVKTKGRQQLFKYLSVFVLNYATGIGAMYIFHDLLGANYLLVRSVTVLCFVPINFVLYRVYVYRKKS